jgi:hypothetical protein
MNALDSRLAVLNERLRADLAEALGPDVLPKLVLFLATSELICEDMQPQDRGALRLAVAHLALQTLGVTDAAVEAAKTTLVTGRDPESLTWRH